MWGSVPLSPQCVRCPVVTASGTVQGQKGVRFLPDAKRGNNSAPVRQVGDERGAGAHFLTRKLTVQNRQQGTARICHFLALRGGAYNNSSGAGLFGLSLPFGRGYVRQTVGFRPALAPSRQMPGGHGFRDGTGGKGDRFLPGAKRGNSSLPARQVGNERGAGNLGKTDAEDCPSSMGTGAGVGEPAYSGQRGFAGEALPKRGHAVQRPS